MHATRWVISGIAGAALFVAGASTPVAETKDEQYYRKAFVFSEWPADFRPDLALTMTCNAGKVNLHPVNLAVSPPKKLTSLPASMPKTMLYPSACLAYFTSSSNPALPEQAFGAVVFDKDNRLVQGAGGAGSAEMEAPFSWLLLKEGYTAYIQLNKGSKAPSWSPDSEGHVSFPELPRN